MEILVTANSNILDGEVTQQDKLLEGHVTLWMIPVYGILLTFMFEPAFLIIRGLDWYIRYIIWCISFTLFEWLAGWIYDKKIGFCPWLYDTKDKIGKGYARWAYLPAWGIAGLVVERLYNLLIYLSPYVSKYFLG